MSTSERDAQSGLPRPCLRVVGLGVSAGGLDTLRQLLPALPSDSGFCFVVAQHLDSAHRSVLASLLQERCSMPVSAARSGDPLRPNHVYVIPSASDARLVDGALVLSPTTDLPGPHPSVNLLFTSQAEECGENAVAVVLSGAGSDGALGAVAVKAAGGIVLVQRPDSAPHDGMPRAAIATGKVDAILPLEGIAEELRSLASLGHLEAATDPDDEALGGILTLLLQRTHCDFAEYKVSTLVRRVARRVAQRHLSNMPSYLELVEREPEELDLLARELLISVTHFFRDPEAFRELGAHLELVVRAKEPGETVRVWVPGCATGEEAYSLAILLDEIIERSGRPLRFQIFGTDIDAAAITEARRGTYSTPALAGMSVQRQQRYFLRSGSEYTVVKPLRDRIVFARQDLVRDPPLSKLDLVACRNLLIYFNASLQRRLLPLFHYALEPEGLLFLGRSETVGEFQHLFEPVAKRWRVYRRRDSGGIRVPMFQRPSLTRERTVTPGVDRTEARSSLADAMDHGLAAAFQGAAVLVDENADVLHVRGDTQRFLRFAVGDVRLRITDLVSSRLSGTVQALLRRVRQEGGPAMGRALDVAAPDGRSMDVSVTAHALQEGPRARGGLVLLCFDASESASQRNCPDPVTIVEDDRIVALEQELAATREQLQGITEELQTLNEELQSVNEEIQSANEELQSSNEELETSNEELQATNEELSTVNDELEMRSAELAETNGDLENVLKRIGLPLVVVDRNLGIRRFTPGIAAIFDLVPGDRGRSLLTVHCLVELPDLREIVRQVVEEGRPCERQVDAGRRYYELRVSPSYDASEQVDGAILAFHDQTEIHRRQQEFLALVENAPDVVSRIDRSHRHLYVSPSIEAVTGLQRGVFIGKTNRDLGMPERLCRLWDGEIDEVFRTDRERRVTYELAGPQGPRVFESRMVPEHSPDGRVVTILSVGRDITNLRRAHQAAEHAAEELRGLLESLNEGFFALDEDLRVTYFNATAGRLLGRDPAEVLGRHLFEAFPEAAGSLFEVQFRRCAGTRQASSFEVHVEVPPYENWFAVRTYPHATGGITVFFEVTTARKAAQAERERLENQLRHAQKMEAIGVLAGGIAHDFNNILGAILGHAEIAEQEPALPANVAADLKQIRQATERGRAVARRILDFSRPSAGQQVPVRLGLVVREALDLLRATLPSTVEIDAQLPDTGDAALADPGQLHQVVMNLCANAAQAMPHGGRMRVRLDSVHYASEDEAPLAVPAGRYQRLRVTDTGVGMPPEVLDRVFEPFFTTKAPGEGSGLGLSVVHGIVQAHGGHLLGESSPGIGSTFTVLLPESEAGPEETRRPTLSEVPGHGERILFVDDEPLLCSLAERSLSQMGYRVTALRSSRAALETFATSPTDFDLLVTDLTMPEMTGIELAREICALRCDLPILLCTGYGAELTEVSATAAGVRRILSKPVARRELAATVREMLDERGSTLA